MTLQLELYRFPICLGPVQFTTDKHFCFSRVPGGWAIAPYWFCKI
jgi:hypothetical protein